MPTHASREIFIIFGSLTTCDPGDIGETIKVTFPCSCVLLSVSICHLKAVCESSYSNYIFLLQELKGFNIRCSIIGLSAEVRICKRICQETKGMLCLILTPGFPDVCANTLFLGNIFQMKRK